MPSPTSDLLLEYCTSISRINWHSSLAPLALQEARELGHGESASAARHNRKGQGLQAILAPALGFRYLEGATA